MKKTLIILLTILFTNTYGQFCKCELDEKIEKHGYTYIREDLIKPTKVIVEKPVTIYKTIYKHDTLKLVKTLTKIVHKNTDTLAIINDFISKIEINNEIPLQENKEDSCIQTNKPSFSILDKTTYFVIDNTLKTKIPYNIKYYYNNNGKLIYKQLINPYNNYIVSN